MKNKILSLVLVVCLVQTFVAALPMVAGAANSGRCGNGVEWTLSSSQVLTISGNGTMEDYAYCQPWARVKKLIIKNGVRNIGKAIFKNSTSLTSVEIGDDVTTIGAEAFRDCSNLKSVKFGKNVSEIGEDAFIFCENLTDVELPDSLKVIGRCSFMFTGIKSIKIPDGVTTIDVSAFQACEGLTSVEIPDSVTSLEYGAFSHCTGLTSVKIGDGVKRLDDETFSNCSSLKTIEFGNKLTYIYSDAFNDCDSLKIVNYRGNEHEWRKLYRNGENKSLPTVSVNYINKSEQDGPVISVLLDGRYLDFDVFPQIINDRTMVPIRAIFEAMGADVNWDDNTKTVTCNRYTTTVEMTINSKELRKNGEIMQMDVAPVIIDGRTLVPARFVAESFDANVQWDGANNTVVITTK